MPSDAISPSILDRRRDAGAGLALVTLTPPRGQASTYRAPGQYIEVRAVTGETGYFALASSVGAPSWELLVRRNGGSSDLLLDAPEGTAFGVVGPLGDGFPIERARGRPLIVAVTGSALAVARPLLLDRLAHREGPSTTVYIGVRTARDVPLADEVARWVHAGVRVVLSLSKSDPAAAEERTILSGARRATGYVQSAVIDDVDSGAVTEALVFAAGPDGMVADLRRLQGARAPKLEVIANV